MSWLFWTFLHLYFEYVLKKKMFIIRCNFSTWFVFRIAWPWFFDYFFLFSDSYSLKRWWSECIKLSAKPDGLQRGQRQIGRGQGQIGREQGQIGHAKVMVIVMQAYLYFMDGKARSFNSVLLGRAPSRNISHFAKLHCKTMHTLTTTQISLCSCISVWYVQNTGCTKAFINRWGSSIQICCTMG